MLEKVGVVFLLLFVYHTGCYENQEYRIGGLFSDVNQEMAFHIAAKELNKQFLYTYPQMELVPETLRVSPYNALEAYQATCKLLEEGIVGLFGPSSTSSSPYIQSLCDLKEIPHIEMHKDLNLERNYSLVNIYPHPRILSNIFIDLIKAYNWHRLIIIYDTDDNLLSVSALVELNGYNDRTVVLRQLESDDRENDMDNYRPMLTSVKLTGQTNFVLACSVDILEEVLRQLQQVGMMTDTYSYIITNLDMQTVELLPFQYAGTNITGIRMFNPDQPEVTRIAEEIEAATGNKNYGVVASWKLRLETALIVDAVQLFFETIYYLTEDKKMSIKAKPLSCNSNNYWADGYTIINLMKTISVDGLTGRVKFDVEGFRRDFNIDVLDLRPGGLLKVGVWNSTARTFKFQRPHKATKPNEQESLFNTTFTVLISISPPYAFLKETTTQLVGNDRYEGFCVDVIHKLSNILGFNYTFIIQEDGANGNYNKTKNEWNGMIKEIIDGRADLAITDLTVTSERESAVDFTMPFMNLGISILYKKPEPVPPSLFMFASPFSISVWLMLGVSYFVVSLAFFVMGRLSPTEWQNPYPCVEEPEYLINQFTVRNSLWFTIGALMQQGTELAPIAISTRAASGVWWFFVLIMVSSYTANLAAFLTVETLVTPFKNVDELANQKIIKYGAKKNGATANYFRDSNVTSYHKIWNYMVRHPELMTNDNDEGVRRVESENYAFLMESTTIEYVTERHCSLAQVGGLLDDKGYGIAMKKDSPYRNELSRAVLKLQETGVLTSLKIKWWKEKRGGGKCSSKSEGGEATALDLQNVGGVFLVLAIGSILGFIGSFIELTVHVYRKAHAEKLSFRDELKREFKFFLQLKQLTKEVTANVEDANENQLIDNNEKYSI